MAFFKNIKIRNKILLANSVLFIIIITITGAVLLTQMKSVVENNINTELQQVTEGLLNTAYSTINSSVKNYLKAISEKAKCIVEYYYKKYKDGILTEQEAYNEVKNLFLSPDYNMIGITGYLSAVDSNGLFEIHPKSEGINAGKYDFVQHAIKIKKGYIEYEWQNVGEKFPREKVGWLTYFEPWDLIIWASSYKNEFAYLIDMKEIREKFLAIKIGKSGYATIMDSRGNLIIHPYMEGKNIYNSQDANGRYFIKEICNNKNGKTLYPWKNPDEQEDREKVAYYKYIPEMDWLVISTYYVNDIYEPLDKIKNIIFLSMLLSIIMLVTMSFWISSYITGSITTFTQYFELGAKSSLFPRIKVDTKDEIGQMAEYFNIFIEKLENSKKILEQEVENRTKELSKKNDMLEETLKQLQTIQAQIIVQEKLASLGALTAGIAHEIKNPLNFINNFSEVSLDLVKKLKKSINMQKAVLKNGNKYIIEDLNDLELCTTKINKHGKRADSIVRSMLLLYRGKSGERQMTDLNSLLKEYASFSYHGMRAQDISFDATINIDVDESINPISVVPQDISRVFLNIINNSLNAVYEKKKKLGLDFFPTINVSTKNKPNSIDIIIKDNGIGIPKDKLDKIFDPFFTTKSPGQGTGLGLSISYDIIVQKHNGKITIKSNEGEYTEVTIILPKNGKVGV